MATVPTPSRAPHLRRAITVSLLAGSAALAGLSGCASPRGPRHGPPEPPQPALAAHADFCSGSVVAEARVTPFRRGMQNAGQAQPVESSDDRGRSGLPPGGGMGPPPRGGGGSGHAGGPPPSDHDSEARSSGRPEGGRGFASLPRQTLHIGFTNRSSSPVTLTVTELNSLVGNFAPRPEKLTIAPGATESLQPMSGDAGGLLNWLEVTLSVRQGATVETRTLHLVPTGEPTESGPTEPPPAPHGQR